MSSVSSPSPSDIPATSNSGSGGNGPTNSPLLFVIALGFGVVFTNLWIIVGVKYCFRYNARQRARALSAHDDAAAVDLQNVVPRPHHRRRREKKLMTLDEVNERFPVVRYKVWRAGREAEGLPAEGGIRAEVGSIHEVEGIKPVETTRTEIGEEAARKEVEAAPAAASSPPETGITTTTTTAPAAATPPNPAIEKPPSISPPSHPDDPDHDHDDLPLPPSLLPESGDTCTICLDTLESNETIRGLTCGHAFHNQCLDPWLTGRRACCPLCKKDYYIPKPRPEGEPHSQSPSNAHGAEGRRARQRRGPVQQTQQQQQQQQQRRTGRWVLLPGFRILAPRQIPQPQLQQRERERTRAESEDTEQRPLARGLRDVSSRIRVPRPAFLGLGGGGGLRGRRERDTMAAPVDVEAPPPPPPVG
ncbi:hypothetical protein EX30DRAFT_371192 [Ascodesmis nigricans]|uniref:RING-type domain-containing protein n=1 Tax=Ascodesmis nigricans TaxID=341454 RepID=A0A4S2MZE9_9PEZI|nr:hypothetical protein EX30DRAFT_371192 [Ascodesmis nigricans]